MYFVGIDIGSTTVKVVVIDDENNIIYKDYQRHFSRVREKTVEMLLATHDTLAGHTVKVAITGSAGLGVAKAIDLPFVQEVFATAGAVEKFLPKTDVVVELGGEDAKIIFFGDRLEERMNGSCAGGTGAFIDQMATLLNVTVNELDELSLKSETLYSIASRCGVFAKTDIQPLLNQGARKEDIAASIFKAVVDQTIAGLAQGRQIEGRVLFLGGPLFFIKGLRKQFIDTLKLDKEHANFPENADCFVALGAALHSKETAETNYELLMEKLQTATEIKTSTNALTPLFEDKADYERFCDRHSKNTLPVVPVESYEGDAYLGIDAGSTTTKLVLITPDGGLLHTYYASNLGNPVNVVKKELAKIHEICGDKINIKASAVTGYGEDLIKNAFCVDFGLVETIAHYKAASHFCEEVDFILDIGGQDIKCFHIRNKTVDSIMLNEACSSGCGSFIETFAKALEKPIADFAQMGIYAEHPVDLGSRCTVFMNSSVKQAQKEGATVGDISAGLSISVVKNAIYKVICAPNTEALGKNIVVQGGTFLNNAVLRSFETELQTEVIRPNIAGLMGAFGVALFAKENAETQEKSAIIGQTELDNFKYEVKQSTCGLCGNKCHLTINNFGGDSDKKRKFISGNRCERPLGQTEVDSFKHDLFKYKYDCLYEDNYAKDNKKTRGKIGIPMGLNMYENLPFWQAFFGELGVELVLSPKSSRALYVKGQHTIPSDTVCYPAKLMHGHVEELVDMGVNTIFYPCMPYNFDEKSGDNYYNCPVVAYYPELLSANIDSLKKVKYLAPYFGLHRKKDFEKKSYEYFTKEFDSTITQAEIKKATKSAYRAYEEFKRKIRKKADEMIKDARVNGRKIVVLAGRPYHIDPEINHGINSLITSFGLTVITEDAVAYHMQKEDRKVLNQWTYQARLYSAARYVVTQPDMQLVQLVSFGCGIDSITTDETRSILESGGKLYTGLKIDEINNLGAIKIRIRSLLAAIDARQVEAAPESKES